MIRLTIKVVGVSIELYLFFLTKQELFRLILVGESFFQNLQSLEIIGDMYQYTEALSHYS